MPLSAHGANHPAEGSGQSVQGFALGWLQLFQLISANLPVGSFTYSQGLEWAVEAGWVKGADGFEAWLDDRITSYNVCYTKLLRIAYIIRSYTTLYLQPDLPKTRNMDSHDYNPHRL